MGNLAIQIKARVFASNIPFSRGTVMFYKARKYDVVEEKGKLAGYS
jgi:hypothetical protein